MTENEGIKIVAVNRRARHDYFILDKYEAGIELTGTEIKSVRDSKVDLRDGFARVNNGEAWLENVYIAPYDQGNRYNVEPRRRRRLLLHRAEIDRIMGPDPAARADHDTVADVSKASAGKGGVGVGKGQASV